MAESKHPPITHEFVFHVTVDETGDASVEVTMPRLAAWGAKTPVSVYSINAELPNGHELIVARSPEVRQDGTQTGKMIARVAFGKRDRV
jgi:hypothetical protein